MSVRILIGDSRETLAGLPSGSARCCVTSPPYFGLRDYGVAGQIGLESTPDAYVAELVAVFGEVRRVLADDGTLWLNLGDSYASGGGAGTQGGNGEMSDRGVVAARITRPRGGLQGGTKTVDVSLGGSNTPGIAPKNLIGIPWRVAFALQADGWYLRSDIIWHKPNPMPESVTDRPTKSHEYLFLLAKQDRYYYDADAIAEDCGEWSYSGDQRRQRVAATGGAITGGTSDVPAVGTTRNKRTVWTVPTSPFKEAHFATFPPALIEPCIKAGSAAGDTVLDPFGGAGTTGLVADRLGRSALLCELNPAYAAMAERRIHGDSPLFADVVSHPEGTAPDGRP